MQWTEEREQLLRELWSQGVSASTIATKLGGITRNAVIGKAHRLGLSSRPSPIKRGAELRTAQIMIAPPPKPAAGFLTTPPPGYKPVEQARAVYNPFKARKQCQWPVGDPRKPNFRFCCLPVQELMPYCAEHAVQAYQPVSRKRIGVDPDAHGHSGGPDEKEIMVRA